MSRLDPRNPANAAALRSFEMQHKIRQSTMRLNDEFADLARWERSIKKKDAELAQKGQARRQRQIPVRGSASRQSTTRTVRTRLGTGTVSAPLDQVQRAAAARAKAEKDGTSPTSGGGTKRPAKAKAGSAAAHTYDKGYKKWESFDVEKAIEEVEVEDISEADATGASKNDSGSVPEHVVTGDKAKKPVYVARTQPQRSSPTDVSQVFELERQKGNGHFGKGEFAAAIRCYTKCIGYDSRNPVVYSNRAAAFLKKKEYLKARSDCDSALRLDPQHVKSFLRRALSNNALGRHRAALRDLAAALRISPSSKRLKSELRKTKELHRTSIRKAPRWKVDVSFAAGPSMPAHDSTETKSAPQKVSKVELTAGKTHDQGPVALPLGSSGLKAINANNDDIEDVPINRVRHTEPEVSSPKTDEASAKAALSEATSHEAETDCSDSEGPQHKEVDETPSAASVKPSATAGDNPGDAQTAAEAIHDRKQSIAEAQAAAAANTAAAEAARLAAIEKLSSPKSNYEFLNCWTGLRNNHERAYYLRLIPTKLLKPIFKIAPEFDVLSSLLNSLVLVAEGSASTEEGAERVKPKPSRAVVYLKKIAAGKRFGMAAMLLSDADKNAVRRILNASKKNTNDLATAYNLED